MCQSTWNPFPNCLPAAMVGPTPTLRQAKRNLKMLVIRLTFSLKISTVGLHNCLSRLIFPLILYYSFQKFQYPGLNTPFWLSRLR